MRWVEQIVCAGCGATARSVKELCLVDIGGERRVFEASRQTAFDPWWHEQATGRTLCRACVEALGVEVPLHGRRMTARPPLDRRKRVYRSGVQLDLRRVAELYRAGNAADGKGRLAVARGMAVSPRTASRYITLAREAGAL